MKCFDCLLMFALFLNLILLTFVECKISDKRLCVDQKCSVPVSEAKTLINYNSDDNRVLPFKANEKVTVYSKSAGSRQDLWGAEINGKRGYVPKNLIRETRVFKKPSLTVPTEVTEEANAINKTLPIIENLRNDENVVIDSLKGSFGFSGVSADSVPPDIKPQQANQFEVIDGTTIYGDLKDPITPHSVPAEFSDTSVETPPLSFKVEEIKKPEEGDVAKVEEKESVVPDDVKEEIGSRPGQDSQAIEEKISIVPEDVKEEEKDISFRQDSQMVEEKKSIVPDDVKEEEKDSSSRQSSQTVEEIKSIVPDDVKEEEKDSSSRQESLTVEEKESIVPDDVKEERDSSSIETINTDQSKEKEIKSEKESHSKTSSQDELKTMDNEQVVLSDKKKPVEKGYFSGLFGGGEINEDEEEGDDDEDDDEDDEYIDIEDETELKDNERIDAEKSKEKERSSPVLEMSPTPGLNDLKMEHTTVPKSAEPNDFNNNKDADNTEKNVTLETPNSVITEHGVNTTSESVDSVPSTRELSKVDTEPEPEKQKQEINQNEDNSTKKEESIAENKLTVEAPPLNLVNLTDDPDHVKTEEKTQESKEIEQNILETAKSPSEVLPTSVTNDLPSFNSSASDGSGVISASLADPIKTTESLDSLTESPPESENKTHATEAVADLNLHKNETELSVEQTTEASVLTTDDPHVDKSTNLDPSTIPLDYDKKVTYVDTESSLEDNIADTKEELNPYDSGLEIKDDVDKNNDTSETIETLEKTSSTVKNEDGFAGVVKEVTEDSVKIAAEEAVVVTTEESSEGMFSWFASFFSGSDIPASKTEEVSNVVTSNPEEQIENLWKHPNHVEESQEESCSVPGLGEDTCRKISKVGKPNVWTSSKSSNADFVMMSAVAVMDKVPLELTLTLVVTGITILIFALGHYYIEAHRRDGSLVARINALERDLLVKKKENSILEDAWSNAQCEVKGRDTDLTEIKETNEELLQELEELKAIRLDLEEQVSSLERELDSATETGTEMHRLLSESLSTQDVSQVLLKTVESLREKLDKQDSQIVLLNRSLSEKNEEIEVLQNELSTAEEESKTLNEKLNTLRREKEEEALEIKEKHRALVVQLEEVVETKALEESRMSTEMSKLRISLEEVQRKLMEREAEVEAMKESIRQLRATDQEENLQELYDVAAVSAKLTTALAERDEFKEKFVEEEGARKLLEDHVRVISREVAELKENFEAAEKEKIEALTKLKVLSNYFKEKETELQKEIGTQESMWLQKQGEDHTIYEQMRSLREENEKYKLQNESLKKEICEQESSFKIQLANVEQRAHENWVASRQAERRLKEVQLEASQLRNKLTTSEKNSVNHEDSKQKINETNGDPSSPPPSLMFSPTTSPPFMMYHGIPTGDFIPPPPLLLPFSPDSRPPPLGRISSPPLDPRFSPPPPSIPYSPYEYPYGHHSPSPPPPLPPRTVHKPKPREAGREPKDTVASNYSLDSTEKPTRRGKR